MSDVNRVTLTGRLGKDPEVRSTASGTTVMGLRLAVSERKKNQGTGEWEDYTNWVDCTVFGKRADALSHILAKGMRVCVDGRLHYSSWERDGQTRSRIDVVVDEIVLPSAPKDSQGAGADAQPGYQAATYVQPMARGQQVGTLDFDGYEVPLYSEEEIPF